MQGRQIAAGRLEENALGDFKLEAGRSNTRTGQRANNRLDQIAAAELQGRKVDGETYRARPVCGCARALS